MATNPYFSSNYIGYTAEQDLVESLVIESHKASGWDFKYLPRTLVNYDDLYGEDTKSAFNDAYTLEFYVKSFEGYAGGSFLSKFGLTMTEELTITCARKRFKDEITANQPTITRPREGDLIYIPYQIDERVRVFEISYVNPLEVFSQLGERYTYEIRCRVFDFNGESFSTGDSELDIFENNYLSTEINLVSGSGTFTIGDLVTQTGGWTATVITFNTTTNVLTVSNTKGALDTSLSITNGLTTRAIVSVESEVANDSNMNDNDIISERVDNGLIDFSENNPFSEV